MSSAMTDRNALMELAETDELVEKVARALCVADGFDPDDEISGSQCTGFENFGERWQANERSENLLGGRNYVNDARIAIATIRASLEVD